MKLSLIKWQSCPLHGPLIQIAEQDGCVQDVAQTENFCRKLNTLLDAGDNRSLVKQRNLHEAVSSLPMPAGCRHVRLVESATGQEIGHCFRVEGYPPSASVWHHAVATPGFWIDRIGNVRPGPVLEAGVLTLVADVEGHPHGEPLPFERYTIDF